MEKTLTDLDRLQALIASEWKRYKEAIKENKQFEEVREIYLNIKELEDQIDILMDRSIKLHSGTQN